MRVNPEKIRVRLNAGGGDVTHDIVRLLNRWKVIPDLFVKSSLLKDQRECEINVFKHVFTHAF